MDLMDYRRKIIANSPHLASASGAVATFSDGADDIPLKSLNVDIEPVQSGTGDPSPDNIRPISGLSGVKVTRTGKNLLRLPTFAEINNADSVSSYRSIPIQLAPNTRYYLSTTFLNGYTANGKGMYGLITADPSGNNNWVAFAHSGKADGKQDGTVTTNSDGLLYIRFSGVTEQRLSGLCANSQIQLEEGSTATQYEPYNGAAIPISWQTEAGTVYGGKLDVLSGVLTAYHYYASYNGETLTGRWVSDRNKYVAGTTPTIGAQVVDMSGTGITYHIDPQTVRTLYGNNNIFADTGNIALEYWAHP